tara:strand:+ start:822 stop:1967 length:1146 start_codon:yes stop_codon:yes gene_type:complete
MSKNDIPTEFRNLLHTYNEKLSESSIKTRWSQYKTICKNCDNDAYKSRGISPDFWNNNLQSIKGFIEGLKTTDSKQNYTVVSVVLIKALLGILQAGIEDKILAHGLLINQKLKIKDFEDMSLVDIEIIDLEETIGLINKSIASLKNHELYFGGQVRLIKDKRQKEKDAGEMTEKQADNYIPHRELLETIHSKSEFRLNELINKEAGQLNVNEILELQDIILVRLMIVAPSRTDFGDCKIIRSEEDHIPKDTNYLYMKGDEPYIQINKWKTKKEIGSFRRIPLSKIDGMSDTITKYVTNIPSKQYLFENWNRKRELQPMTSSAFSKYVTKCFKQYVVNKNININLLRHILIGTKKKELHELSDLQELLGHGADTQKSYLLNA